MAQRAGPCDDHFCCFNPLRVVDLIIVGRSFSRRRQSVKPLSAIPGPAPPQSSYNYRNYRLPRPAFRWTSFLQNTLSGAICHKTTIPPYRGIRNRLLLSSIPTATRKLGITALARRIPIPACRSIAPKRWFTTTVATAPRRETSPSAGSTARTSPRLNRDPRIQVVQYNEDTFILRQNVCVHWEAPFTYLLFGNQGALLIDTGATAEANYYPLRTTVDAIVTRWSQMRLKKKVPLTVVFTSAEDIAQNQGLGAIRRAARHDGCARGTRGFEAVL